MPYNSRLKITRGNETTYFDVIALSSSVSVSSMKSDYKIADGNRYRGISQGIGIISSGRTLSYAIPIFEKDDKSIYGEISKYTSIFSSSYKYSFFIEHLIDGVWYFASVVMAEINGYSVNLKNHINGFGFKCFMIDNYFYGDIVSKKLDISGTKICRVELLSESFVQSGITFEWVVNSEIETTFEGFIEHDENYGMSFSVPIGKGRFVVVYNGSELVAKNEDGENEIIQYEGIEPYLDIGKNILRIKSSYETKSFIISYRKGIAL